MFIFHTTIKTIFNCLRYVLLALPFGTKKWELAVDSYSHFCSISNGAFYSGSYNGKLYVTDAATGTGKWSFMTGSDGIAGYPCVVTKQGKVVRGSPDN